MSSKTKIVKKNLINHLNNYSGFPYLIGLQREILCIKLLYNAYLNHGCTCGLNHHHFPILINYKISNNGGFIKMTNQGIDIQQLLKKPKKHRRLNNLNNESIHKQIDCILNILNKANIVHLDLNNNGKNICINENGLISLIDFDIMHIKDYDNNSTLTPLMYNRINRFAYTDFKEKIYNIINKLYI